MTERMTREQVLETIAAARAKGECPDLSGLDLSRLDLPCVDLSGADLSDTKLLHANLARANLAHAKMRYANLYGANLTNANVTRTNLVGATLRGAYLYGANLTGVVLRGADLRNVTMTGLFLDGLPSGDLMFTPTPDGWRLTIGCWFGTTEELRAMISNDDGWPEAEGEDIDIRRPMLEAAATMCDAYAAAHPDDLADVKAAAKRWEENR